MDKSETLALSFKIIELENEIKHYLWASGTLKKMLACAYCQNCGEQFGEEDVDRIVFNDEGTELIHNEC